MDVAIIFEIINKGIKHKFSKAWLIYTILIGSIAVLILFSFFEISKGIIISPIIISLILLFILIRGRYRLNRKWKKVIIIAGLFLIINGYLIGLQDSKVWVSTIALVIHITAGIAVYKQLAKDPDYFFEFIEDLVNIWAA